MPDGHPSGTLHGVIFAPFVRKVRAVLAAKGIRYQQVSVMPGAMDPAFLAKSPLSKVPVWEEPGFVLPDSSAICAYLERLVPTPSLYPAEPRAFAIGALLGGVRRHANRRCGRADLLRAGRSAPRAATGGRRGDRAPQPRRGGSPGVRPARVDLFRSGPAPRRSLVGGTRGRRGRGAVSTSRRSRSGRRS